MTHLLLWLISVVPSCGPPGADEIVGKVRESLYGRTELRLEADLKREGVCHGSCGISDVYNDHYTAKMAMSRKFGFSLGVFDESSETRELIAVMVVWPGSMLPKWISPNANRCLFGTLQASWLDPATDETPFTEEGRPTTVLGTGEIDSHQCYVLQRLSADNLIDHRFFIDQKNFLPRRWTTAISSFDEESGEACQWFTDRRYRYTTEEASDE